MNNPSFTNLFHRGEADVASPKATSQPEKLHPSDLPTSVPVGRSRSSWVVDGLWSKTLAWILGAFVDCADLS